MSFTSIHSDHFAWKQEIRIPMQDCFTMNHAPFLQINSSSMAQPILSTINWNQSMILISNSKKFYENETLQNWVTLAGKTIGLSRLIWNMLGPTQSAALFFLATRLELCNFLFEVLVRPLHDDAFHDFFFWQNFDVSFFC